MKMKKKILIAVGFTDRTTREVPGAMDNFTAVEQSPHLAKFSAIVNVGRPNDTYRNVFFSVFAHDQQVYLTVPDAANAFGFESMLQLGLTGGGLLHEKADQLDFLFPPSQYEVTVAGNDFSGVFQSLFPQLHAMGYSISVYKDANKPISRDSVQAMKSVSPTYFSAKVDRSERHKKRS
mgnify:FL=1